MDTHFHFSGLITHMFPKLTIQGQWSTVQVKASGPTGHHRLTSLPPQWFLWTHSALSVPRKVPIYRTEGCGVLVWNGEFHIFLYHPLGLMLKSEASCWPELLFCIQMF